MTIIADSVAHSRVEAGAGVLGLLYEAGHVLEEEVVHVLLVHVAQLRVAAHVYLQQHDGDNTDNIQRRVSLDRTCGAGCWLLVMVLCGAG